MGNAIRDEFFIFTSKLRVCFALPPATYANFSAPIMGKVSNSNSPWAEGRERSRKFFRFPHFPPPHIWQWCGRGKYVVHCSGTVPPRAKAHIVSCPRERKLLEQLSSTSTSHSGSPGLSGLFGYLFPLGGCWNGTEEKHKSSIDCTVYASASAADVTSQSR